MIGCRKVAGGVGLLPAVEGGFKAPAKCMQPLW
jgi:hypothetical protein